MLCTLPAVEILGNRTFTEQRSYVTMSYKQLPFHCKTTRHAFYTRNILRSTTLDVSACVYCVWRCVCTITYHTYSICVIIRHMWQAETKKKKSKACWDTGLTSQSCLRPVKQMMNDGKTTKQEAQRARLLREISPLLGVIRGATGILLSLFRWGQRSGVRGQGQGLLSWSWSEGGQ